jgi:hypothetical protein
MRGADDIVPPMLHRRVGVLLDSGEIWGYVQVRRSAVTKTVGWLRTRRQIEEPCVVEEFFRLRRPRATDVDSADQLGLSDTIITLKDLPVAVDRLQRNEMLLTGRTLDIEWLSGQDADAIRDEYFAESRFDTT